MPSDACHRHAVWWPHSFHFSERHELPYHRQFIRHAVRTKMVLIFLSVPPPPGSVLRDQIKYRYRICQFQYCSRWEMYTHSSVCVYTAVRNVDYKLTDLVKYIWNSAPASRRHDVHDVTYPRPWRPSWVPPPLHNLPRAAARQGMIFTPRPAPLVTLKHLP